MTNSSEPGSEVREVRLGATRAEGGTREVSYVIGGERDLPFLGNRPDRLLVALEVCDDPRFSPPVVRDYVGDLANNPDEWARAAERTYGADLVRLNFTSTKQRRFDAFGEIATTMDQVLAATIRPLIVEGSSEPELDSEVFRRCGRRERVSGSSSDRGGRPLPERRRSGAGLRSCGDRPVAHRHQPREAVEHPPPRDRHTKGPDRDRPLHGRARLRV